MERGSDKHGARVDDELAAELSGRLGSAGGHREEWAETEPRGVAEDGEQTEDLVPHGEPAEAGSPEDAGSAR